MKYFPSIIFLLLLCVGAFSYYFKRMPIEKGTKLLLNLADLKYVEGEKAKTVKEREDAFNRALVLYRSLASKFDLSLGTGRLYYNIANCYFQLGEYPWALLYYYRAKALMPNASKLIHNLNAAVKKVGITRKEKKIPILDRILFFHFDFSLPRRLQIFTFFSVSATLFLSFYIWTEKKWQKTATKLFASISAIMLASITFTRFLAPIEGVVVSATPLYRDAGTYYAKATERPIFSGNKVRVLDTLHGGKWLKIVTEEGTLGYVPQEAVRII